MNSCKKDISSPGLNLLNSENNAFGSVDTFALKVGSIKVDPVTSSNPAYLMLGSYVDPVFGKYDAGFYAQAIISSLKPDFGDSTKKFSVDSLVLGMRFSDYYGKLDEQNFEVYELSEDLSEKITYDTKSSVSTKANNLVLSNSCKLTPKPYGFKFPEKFDEKIDTIRDNIRLQLDTTLAYRFMKDSRDSSDNFAAKFLSYFKGLHVKVSNSNQKSGEGGVMYFDSPVLTMYYKLDNVPKKFSFVVKGGVRFNHVAFDYTGTNVEKLVLGQVTDQKDFYAQANHVRGTVNLPTIKDIPKNSIIHFAKLILPVDNSSKYIYSYGSEIFVSIHNSSTDQTLRYLTSGELDTAYNGYVIDVRDHIQRVITGKRLNLPLVVSPKFFSSSAERIHFLGPKTLGMDKPRLLIKYSTF